MAKEKVMSRMITYVFEIFLRSKMRTNSSGKSIVEVKLRIHFTGGGRAKRIRDGGQ